LVNILTLKPSDGASARRPYFKLPNLRKRPGAVEYLGFMDNPLEL
jgi:hypothetical protein